MRDIIKDQSGIALIVALSLTLVFSAMALSIVTLSVTEKGIAYNERVAAQALYNADAALEVIDKVVVRYREGEKVVRRKGV